MKQEKTSKTNEEFSIDLKKLKNIQFEYVFLFLFLVLGFYLRVYHIDYPSIGYHNMKENEYVGAAKFMFYDGDYLHRKLYRMGNSDVPYFEEYPQIPLIQWGAVFFWKLFGMHLWIIRLLMILASIGSIYVVYFLIFELSKSKYLALLSSFFMAVLPLGIFFGRNIQPESPALFFLLLAMLYFVKWCENFDKKNVLLFGLYLGIAGLFKYTFLIGLIPMLAIFPYSKFKEKGFFKKIFSSLGPFLLGLIPLVFWTALAPFLNKTSSLLAGTAARIDLFRIFHLTYWRDAWPSFANYIGDNYTWWYFWFAIFGIMLLGLSLKDKKITYLSFTGLVLAILARIFSQGSTQFVLAFFGMFAILIIVAIFSLKYDKPLQRFLLFYALSIIPYCMLLSDFIKAHNYYQMPFLPFVAILSAYFLYVVGSFLKQITGVKLIQFAPLLLILLTVSQVEAHKNAMFDTQFFGLDVMGTYLKNNMADGQRFILYGESQSVAACTYSEHLCIMTSGMDVATLQKAERDRGIQWIAVDAGTGGMYSLQKNPETLNYIQQNYHLVAAGLLKTGQGFAPYSFVLKKGGSVNFANLTADPVFTHQQPIMTTTYEISSGKLEYYLLG